MSSTSKHLFFSRVLQRETIEPAPGLEDVLAIQFFLIKRTSCWYDNPTDYSIEDSSPSSGVRKSMPLLYSRRTNRGEYTPHMIRWLSRIGIPQEEQPTILDKTFGVLQTAFPEGTILVLIFDMSHMTVGLLGSFQDLDTISALICHSLNLNFNLKYMVNDEVRCETRTISGADYHGIIPTASIDGLTLGSFPTRPIIRFVPATKSLIESLQKVRLDSLEEATIKRNLSCNICRDDFAQDQLVIPLPCTHCYHADCIISWLVMKHVCPLCRYAIQTSNCQWRPKDKHVSLFSEACKFVSSSISYVRSITSIPLYLVKSFFLFLLSFLVGFLYGTLIYRYIK